jgi:K+-transporting ATPase ATPase C chain
MKTNIGIALRLLLVMTVLTGILYPVALTMFAQSVFPDKSNGSLLEYNHKLVGSRLIGQKFENDRYFWSRPSAIDYQPLPSGGSNLGMTSLKLKELYETRKKLFIQKNKINSSIEIPAEMLYSSASGIDPHISVKAAELQIYRITQARHLKATEIQQLSLMLKHFIEKRQLYLLGEPRINVLVVNIELDKIFNKD